jgi:hypothetical protein
MDFEQIYSNPDMARVYTAFIISTLIEEDEGAITWNFVIHDIDNISKLLMKQNYLGLLTNYGKRFSQGVLRHFERQELYERCVKLSMVLTEYGNG